MTTPNAHQPTDLQLHQATMILSEIAQLAANTDQLFYFMLGEFDGTGHLERNAFTKLNNLRQVVNTMGMFADMALEKLTGSPEIRGGVEEWLMSPLYPTKEEPSHG